MRRLALVDMPGYVLGYVLVSHSSGAGANIRQGGVQMRLDGILLCLTLVRAWRGRQAREGSRRGKRCARKRGQGGGGGEIARPACLSKVLFTHVDEMPWAASDSRQ